MRLARPTAKPAELQRLSTAEQLCPRLMPCSRQRSASTRRQHSASPFARVRESDRRCLPVV